MIDQPIEELALFAYLTFNRLDEAEDFEDFETYKSHLKSHFHLQQDDFKERFKRGYNILLKEIEQDNQDNS